MEKPTLYKKTDLESVRSRQTSPLTVDEQTQVDATIAKFFELFKARHM